MEDFTNANRLIQGYRRVKKCSGWKDNTQKYGLNLLKEVRALQREQREGSYRQGQGSTFRQCEQGHIRLIKALTVRDTVMQHALCDSVLVTELSRHLIHDNGASLKGKGISFTRRRFEQHLRWHFRRYGREGYLLKIDFRKYFDNIRHDVLEREIARHIKDERVMGAIRATKNKDKSIVGLVINVPPGEGSIKGEGAKVVRIIEEADLSPEVQAAFETAEKGLVGVSYKPVLCLGSQVARGVNHYIICQAKTIYPGAEPYAVGMVLNVFEGNVSVVGLAPILPNAKEPLCGYAFTW